MFWKIMWCKIKGHKPWQQSNIGGSMIVCRDRIGCNVCKYSYIHEWDPIYDNWIKEK